ncbi:MAG: hypothetical protein K9M55_04840 [Candidatus Marinimicrobia bacterium]|nr:hypothetical protein [Candidatus Neomarinimicrobiota bacterium]
MKSILATHASILQKIPLIISKKYGLRSDQIKLGNISTIDESIMTFQLSFFDPQSSPREEIILTFELRESAPHMLYFETLIGLKGYEKSNEYHGLDNEIIKYITIKMDE